MPEVLEARRFKQMARRTGGSKATVHRYVGEQGRASRGRQL